MKIWIFIGSRTQQKSPRLPRAARKSPSTLAYNIFFLRIVIFFNEIEVAEAFKVVDSGRGHYAGNSHNSNLDGRKKKVEIEKAGVKIREAEAILHEVWWQSQ